MSIDGRATGKTTNTEGAKRARVGNNDHKLNLFFSSLDVNFCESDFEV